MAKAFLVSEGGCNWAMPFTLNYMLKGQDFSSHLLKERIFEGRMIDFASSIRYDRIGIRDVLLLRERGRRRICTKKNPFTVI